MYKEQIEIEENLKLIAEKKAEAEAKSSGGMLINRLQQIQLLNELKDAESGFVTAQEENAARRAIVDQTIATNDTASAQAVLDNAVAQKQAAADIAQAEEEAAARRTEAIAGFTTAATDMFTAIDTKSDASVQNMIETLQKNKEAMANYELNMTALRDRFATLGLDDAVIQQLANMGTAGIPHVAELVTGTDAQLQELVTTFDASTTNATGAGIANIQAANPKMQAAAAGLVDAAATGINDNPAVQEASKKTVADAKDAMETQIEASDFAASGTAVAENISDGISDSRAVEEAAKSAVAKAKSAAAGQVSASDFSSIGLAMINGITAGVNAGASSLVSAMVSAAVSAYTAAQRALDINSPSRLFRDMVGLQTMKGWAQGIEKGEGLLTGSVEAAAAGLTTDATASISILPKMQMAAFASNLRAAVQTAHAGFSARIASTPSFAQAAPTPATPFDPALGNQIAGAVAAAMPKEIKTQTSIVLDGRAVFQGVKKAEANYGYNVGGLQNEW